MLDPYNPHFIFAIGFNSLTNSAHNPRYYIFNADQTELNIWRSNHLFY